VRSVVEPESVRDESKDHRPNGFTVPPSSDITANGE
jgi:hypothetical protein